MRSLPLVLVALATPALAAPSRIASVLVYPDRAQVTRTVSLPCEGRPVALFEGLPPSADRLSLRARAVGAQVSKERDKLTLFFPNHATKSLANVRANGQVAVCFSRQLDKNAARSIVRTRVLMPIWAR